MNIYPKHLLRPCFKGEAYIRTLFGELKEDWTVIHSVNLPKHVSKRWGEIDFLIIREQDVIALEIKGGYVTCVDGLWTYSNGKESYTSYESPLEQVQAAVIALEKMVAKDLLLDIRIAHGLVFPFTFLNENMFYFPREKVADKAICQEKNTFINWMNQLCSGTYNKKYKHFELDQLKNYLLPKFDITMTRRLSHQFVLEQIHEYTEEQKKYFSLIDSNKMIVVFGSAGSGKTELLIHTAIKELLHGNRPIVLTKHQKLNESLQERLKDWDINITSGDIPPEYNVLLIDEGQDFHNKEILQPYLNRFQQGKIRIFMDKNYQFLNIPPEKELLDWYATHAVIVNLDTNVRNTEYMINTVEALMQVDMGLARIQGIGNKVSFEIFDDEKALESLLFNTVDKLCLDNIDQNSIVILYQKYDLLIFNVINNLKKYRASVRKFTSIKDCENNFLVYTDIWSYRGLEADQVILILNDPYNFDDQKLSDIYIGMTRSRVNLTILCHSEYLYKLLV